jgi:hypothetical protein
MKFFLKSIAFIFLFLTVHFLYAQDTVKIIKAKRNAFKIGISPIPTKIFFSYEHAFTKHISVGGMASYGGTTFDGYTCNIFTRYYFSKFNENGFFVEARGSYAHFNPYVYTYSYRGITQGASDESDIYEGRHQANIDYWSAGISGGYKVFLKEYGHSFFEFIAGVHNGKATFGSNDLLLGNGNDPINMIDDDVKVAFDKTGPGFPLHFIINFGFAF